MDTELQTTWGNIATNWDKWKAPLRPSPEDVALILSSLSSWTPSGSPANVFLLGVTPELVAIEYPFPSQLLAMDISQSMIDHVWPGNIPGQRRAMLGDWLDTHLPDNEMDLVLADGSFIFFDPMGMKNLADVVSKVMKPDGRFVARFFIQGANDSLTNVLADLNAGKITNFHSFKFRVAMALQKDMKSGVSQNDIYEQVQKYLSLFKKAPFSEDDKSTIEFYKGKTSKHYFPNADQLKIILGTKFKNIDIVYPTYEFGNHCPTVVCSGLK